MEYLVLDMTVISAEGLKNVNTFFDMAVYVVGMISGDRRTERRTHIDRQGGSSPEWNHRMKFSVATGDLARPATQHWVRFQLRSERVLGDRDIGYVFIRLQELLKTAAGERVVELKVRDPTGKITDATLKFSYRFDEKFTVREPGMGCAPPPGVAPPPHLPLVVYRFPPQTAGIECGCALSTFWWLW